MNAADSSAAALKEWLETESGYAYVLHLADRLKWDSQSHRAFSTHLAQRFSCSPEDLRDEIAQEFLAFLLQSFLPQLKNRPEQVNAVLTGQVRKVLIFALQQFSWRLQDSARQKEVNPLAYLHRRIREVLRQDNRFVIHKDGQNRVACSLASHTETTSENYPDFHRLNISSGPARRNRRVEMICLRQNIYPLPYIFFWRKPCGCQGQMAQCRSGNWFVTSLFTLPGWACLSGSRYLMKIPCQRPRNRPKNVLAVLQR
jgi:hypothetical protein